MKNRYRFILFFILGFYMSTIIGCIGTPPTPDDNKKSTPQCCRGQETHTCDMPGMLGKPLPARKVG